MRKHGSFGYAIDYDRAIAEDEAMIRSYDGPVIREISASLSPEEVGWIERGLAYGPLDWLWYSLATLPRRAAVLQLDRDDLVLLAALLDADRAPGSKLEPWVEAYATELPEGRRGWYVKAEAVVRRIEAEAGRDVLPEDRRIALVRKARADLARHARNKARLG